MKYYNIHTHKKERPEDVVAIYCLTEEEILEEELKEIPNLYYSCGIHPWKVDNTTIEVENLRLLVERNKQIVSIGEVGLDTLSSVSYEMQKEYFEKQIALSIEFDLPITIHCVRAWDDLIQFYKKYNPSQPWIVHGFRGGAEQAKQLRRLGLWLSLGEHYNRETVNVLYSNGLLLETDESQLPIRSVYDRIEKELGIEKYSLVQSVEQNVSFLFNFNRKQHLL